MSKMHQIRRLQHDYYVLLRSPMSLSDKYTDNYLEIKALQARMCSIFMIVSRFLVYKSLTIYLYSRVRPHIRLVYAYNFTLMYTKWSIDLILDTTDALSQLLSKLSSDKATGQVMSKSHSIWAETVAS